MKATHSHRQAIRTRHLGPTDTRGSRIVASAAAGRIVLPWDHSLSEAENHARAAAEFARRFDWADSFVGGGLDTGDQCWVPV